MNKELKPCPFCGCKDVKMQKIERIREMAWQICRDAVRDNPDYLEGGRIKLVKNAVLFAEIFEDGFKQGAKEMEHAHDDIQD